MSKRVFLIITVGVAVILAGLGFWYYKSRPLISVVMASHNRIDFIDEAVTSILNQTEPDFEFIIIDDASEDGTYEKLQSYARQDKRIRLFRNEVNQGLVYNLNKGLDLARGRFIARMDDDDIAYPERFEKQSAFLKQHPEITVLGSIVSPIGSDFPYPFQKDTDWRRNAIWLYLGICPVSHPSVMIRRDFLNQHAIRYDPDFASAEDRPFWGAVISAGGRIVVFPEVLLHYRMGHTKSINYIKEQRQNLTKFHDAYISHFGFKHFKDMNRCGKLIKMIELNPEKKLLEQEALEDIFREECPDLALLGQNWPMPAHHTDWTDYFLKEGDDFIRRLNGERGLILMLNGTTLQIKWEKDSKEEIFILEDGIWQLDTRTPQNISVKHPYWEDTVTIIGKRFIRSDGDMATILNETPDLLVVTWDQWGVERFQKEKDYWRLKQEEQ